MSFPVENNGDMAFKVLNQEEFYKNSKKTVEKVQMKAITVKMK